MPLSKPFVKCYSDIPYGFIASPEEKQGRIRNMEINGYGMVLLCLLLRLMVKWSQGLAAPKITRQLQKIQWNYDTEALTLPAS